MEVNFGHKECELYLQVAEGVGPDFMGRYWMAALKVTLNTGK